MVTPATEALRDQLVAAAADRFAAIVGGALRIHAVRAEASLNHYAVAESNKALKIGLERRFERMYVDRQKLLQQTRAASGGGAQRASAVGGGATAYAFDHLVMSGKKRVMLTLAQNEATPASASAPASDDAAAPVVLFSDTLSKFNSDGVTQTRHFAVTAVGIYNFKPSEYETFQRYVPIAALTDVVAARRSHEVVLQVKGEYDYRVALDSKERRDQFMRVVCEQFKRVAKRPISLVILDTEVCDDRQRCFPCELILSSSWFFIEFPVLFHRDLISDAAQSLEDHACTKHLLPVKLLMEEEMRTALVCLLLL